MPLRGKACALERRPVVPEQSPLGGSLQAAEERLSGTHQVCQAPNAVVPGNQTLGKPSFWWVSWAAQ